VAVAGCSFLAEPDITDRPPLNLMVRTTTADTSNAVDAKAARTSVTGDALESPARCDLIGDITRQKIHGFAVRGSSKTTYSVPTTSVRCRAAVIAAERSRRDPPLG
jgi:hypothetical protein